MRYVAGARLLSRPLTVFAPASATRLNAPLPLATYTNWLVSFDALSFHVSVIVDPDANAVRFVGAFGTVGAGGGGGVLAFGFG